MEGVPRRLPDPGSNAPDLSKYAEGDALALLVKGLTSMADDGLVGTGDIAVHPKVVEVRPGTPAQAKISDCMDSSASHLVKADGSPYDDEPGGMQSGTATVVELADGTWRVSSFAVHDVGSC